MSQNSHYAIIRGGIPTAAQVAALMIALTPVPAAPARSDDDRRDRTGVDRASGWVHAARHEAAGGPTIAAMADLGDRH